MRFAFGELRHDDARAYVMNGDIEMSEQNTTPAENKNAQESSKEQKAAVALHGKVVAAIKKAESSLEVVAALIVEAKESNIHEQLGLPSWQAWLESAVAESGAKLLGPVLRNQMLKLMIEAGVSVRSAARALEVSKSTADRVAHGSTTGERKGTPGAPKGVPQSKRSAAVQAIDAIEKAVGTFDKADLGDMKALRAKLASALKVTDAAIAHREDRQRALIADEAAKDARKAASAQGNQPRTGQVAA